MAMELETHERTYQASRQHEGDHTFTATAGQALKIETSPGGEEILNTTCPADKSWTIHITVAINEVDL